MGLAAPNDCFSNLAAEATNEKAVFEVLATNLITFTTRNAEMTNIIKKFMGENCQLRQQINSLQKKLPQEDLRSTGK